MAITTALSAITDSLQEWSPRPTFQVSTEISDHLNRTLSSSCLGMPDVKHNDTYTTTGYSFGAVIALSVLCSLFCLYVLLGNIAVIAIICTDKIVGSQTQNQYLISLAVADALLAILIVPFSLVNELHGSWPFGPIYCKIYLAADVLLCTASIWNICAIGLDRYWSVNTPLANRKKRTKKVTRLVILLVWTLSFLISVPPFIFGFNTIPVVDGNSCFINNEPWYIVFSCTLSFFLPTIIIAPVYTRIYKIGRQYAHSNRSRGFNSLNGKSKARTPKQDSDMLLRPRSGQLELCREVDVKVEREFVSLETNGRQDVVCKLITANSEQVIEKNGCSERCYDCQFLYPTKDGKKMHSKAKKEMSHECSVTSLQSPPSENATTARKTNGIPTERKRIMSNTSTHSVFSVASLMMHLRRRPTPDDTESISKMKTSVSMKRERRFTFIICAVTGGFLICWYPFFQTYVLYAICRETCCINKTVFKLIFWLGYLNSGLNPAIYTIFNKEFRRSFRGLLRCCLQGKLRQNRAFSRSR